MTAPCNSRPSRRAHLTESSAVSQLRARPSANTRISPLIAPSRVTLVTLDAIFGPLKEGSNELIETIRDPTLGQEGAMLGSTTAVSDAAPEKMPEVKDTTDTDGKGALRKTLLSLKYAPTR